VTRRLLVLSTAVTAVGCSGNQNVFNPAGPGARDIANLGWFMFAVCGAVYALVLIALAWALMRRRHASDSTPETERRLTRTVVGALGATIAILLVFMISSVVAGRGLTSPRGPGAVTIDAVGHQWWWEFQYRDLTPSDFVTSPNEMRIPVGVPIHIKAVSRDVVHSFWVPNLHGKRDLIPGQVTNFWIQADRPGVYRGQCAEFCGHQHANMAFTVVAEPMEKFQAWIQHQRQAATEPRNDEEKRGQQVFLQTTCSMCHTIRGTSAGSRVGPELTHVASRLTLAAGAMPNTRGHLAGWVINSQSVKPGNRMPPNPLAPDDLRAVLTYLRSLR
jgi:cytochrome c oxidase subunit 2